MRKWIDGFENFHFHQALIGISYLIIVEDESGVPIAFMGIAERKFEMSFIAPKERGRGLAKRLLEHGIKEYAINELEVNEQNPQAKEFYEHMGFQVYKRTETDFIYEIAISALGIHNECFAR